MRRACFVLSLFLLLAIPAAAGLPGLARPTRPVTDLRCAKSTNDVVLTWTTTPSATYGYIVTRGVLQPEFKAEKIVAVTADLTWTDVGAITRTVLGVSVNEFYRVYAVWVSPPHPMEPRAWRNEHLAIPRDLSQICKFSVGNGAQFTLGPKAQILGRDDSWRMTAAISSPTDFLFDLYNFPTNQAPAGASLVVQAEPGEAYPSTVDHEGYYAGLVATVGSADQALTSLTTRSIPAPSLLSRVGQVVTMGWTAPPEDVAGNVTGIELYRTYEGVGSDTGTLVGTYAASALQGADTITAVTTNWYCFYAIRLVFADGTKSLFSASSAPVRR